MAMKIARVATLDEAWASFAATVVGPFKTAAEIAELKETFYAGATMMLGLLLRYAGDGDLEVKLVEVCKTLGLSDGE